MRPILSDEEFNELTMLSEKFQKGLGPRLQRYLFIKSLLSSNYVGFFFDKNIFGDLFLGFFGVFMINKLKIK